AGWGTCESRVVANTNRLLDLFDAAGVKATFFVLGWIADRFGALVREIAGRGHEIASHGYHHQLVYTLTPQQFRDDLRTATPCRELLRCSVLRAAPASTDSGHRATRCCHRVSARSTR